MKKLLLHIGQSKTGTTALQSFLFKNKKHLKEQGVLYPDYYQAKTLLSTREHNAFADSLAGLPKHPYLSLSSYMQQFKSQMKDHECHTMILSAESFFGAPQIWRIDEGEDFFSVYEQKLKNLREFTQEFEQVHVIGYLRPPEDWFESAVSQIIRYEGLLGTRVYESDEALASLLAPHMNYSKILTLWHDTIKPQKITIRPYDRSAMINQDIIHDFCDGAGLDITMLKEEPEKSQMHKSLDHRYLIIKRELNKTPRSKTQERVILECLDQLNGALPAIKTYQIDEELKVKIKTQNAEQEEWLAQEFGKGEKPFFKRKSKPKGKEVLKKEDLEKAQEDFERLYASPTAKIMGAKIYTKALLRNKTPNLYAAVKKVHNDLKKVG